MGAFACNFIASYPSPSRSAFCQAHDLLQSNAYFVAAGGPSTPHSSYRERKSLYFENNIPNM